MIAREPFMTSDKTTNYPMQRFSVAPMLDWTDRHCRYFHRLLSGQTLLYTEMITTGAILFGKGNYLAYSQQEQPVALQLGGSDPQALAECAKRAEELGYNEVNLNAGCPSDRVQNGRFGACLMAEPELVADCIKAMKSAVSIPCHGEKLVSALMILIAMSFCNVLSKLSRSKAAAIILPCMPVKRGYPG
ncbi:Probable tRNA-dihydrouridine synthase [Budvicia aquatica]|uniref:Probable tRNA-dihydrouridine synthase n=1 Tax=Budvicia aquatica TaxID=82979 RepID=A0A484ZDI1_9GAMM|nr:Probable tRNA-dihydrouridine synthase [Budvicia aquatica]